MKEAVNHTKGHGFGTAPVFLAAVSTILGAILFLRFGYAVSHAGLLGVLLMIAIGHAITIPTAMAIAEIATNLKVEGGGEYYIISRSFGSMVGGTIGISLYLSQAISVAFYMIAFSEAFTPLFPWIEGQFGFTPATWMFSVPATLLLLVAIIRKGASLGVGLLWVVVMVLGVSLLLFFLGGTPASMQKVDFNPWSSVENPDDFFIVFAIIFPAFTGMTAGVGLSGDLKNPRKSIPLGTLSATLVGMVVYVLIVVKMAYSLPAEALAADQLVMGKIALWGPIIPIGLVAATLSSAIGSILIAPRTLQALAGDSTFPMTRINKFLKKGVGPDNEPRNATLITSALAMVFVALGSVDLVAQIISMFFMITYGTLCLVSFLEHFAGNPSYRPTFRSRWYLSLLGSIACFFIMFQMSALYAFVSLITIVLIYLYLRRGHPHEDDLSAMLRGVLFQLTRRLQVIIQKKNPDTAHSQWRPSFIAISDASHERLAPFDLLRWISHHYGFGTFIHYLKGPLDTENQEKARLLFEHLIQQTRDSRAGLYVDTIISPSFKTAVAQIVQIPGVSGMDNNSILFEFHHEHLEAIEEIVQGCRFAAIVDYNISVLRSSDRHFGYRQRIDIWLTPGDYRNAGLMIMLAYILGGHPEWRGAEITLYAAFEEENLDQQVTRLNNLIDRGRIPISQNNVRKVSWKKDVGSFNQLVCSHSADADLVILGFSLQKLTAEKGLFFTQFDTLSEVLFVRAGQRIAISDEG